MEIPADIKNAVEQASEYYGVDENLIYAIIQQESGFNPNALGDKDAWGNPHSFGLMQLYDKGAGAGYSPEYLLDIYNNVNIGTNYLKRCLDAFGGDIVMAVSAYNQGISGARVRGWTYNRDYVDSVLANYESFKGIVVEAVGEAQSVLEEGWIPIAGETKADVRKIKRQINVGCLPILIFIILIIAIIFFYGR